MTARREGHVTVATLLGVVGLLLSMGAHMMMTAERLAVLETQIMQCVETR